MARKAANGAPRREEFLRAALLRFARQGFAATSTRQICADLSIAHSAIYNYFPTKEDLLLAIGEREMAEIQGGLDALLGAMAQAGPRARLEAAARYTIEQAILRRDAWRLIVDMLRSLKPKHRARMVALRDRFEAVLRDALQRAAESGEVDVDDVQMTVFHLLGMADAVSRWYRPTGRLGREAIAEQAAGFFLRAIRPAAV
jgi:AcrR family transcriptional regulator